MTAGNMMKECTVGKKRLLNWIWQAE